MSIVACRYEFPFVFVHVLVNRTERHDVRTQIIVRIGINGENNKHNIIIYFPVGTSQCDVIIENIKLQLLNCFFSFVLYSSSILSYYYFAELRVYFATVDTK